MVEHTFNLNIQEAEWGRPQCLRLVWYIRGFQDPVYKQTNKNNKQKKNQV